MKRLYMAVLIIAMVSCGQLERQRQYVKDAKGAIGDAEWLSFNVAQTWDTIGGVTNPYEFSVVAHLNNENPYYVVLEDKIMRYTMIMASEALVVNGRNRELCRFAKNKDDETGWFEQISYETARQLEYLSFYTVLFPTKVRNLQLLPLIKGTTDTTLFGVAYRKYEILNPKSLVWNKETNAFDIPVQYASQVWLNLATNQLDSVFVHCVSDFHFGKKEYYRISDMNCDNKSKFVDSLFNFSNPAYMEYTMHTESFPPFSRIASRNESLDESVLLFPFVGIQQDIITIGNADGWLLLDIWQFGCQPCYQGLERLRCERDSLGQGIIESEGIRIIAANANSDNMELIAKVAEKYNAQDLIYAGKGFASKLSLVNYGYPSYYLISPEKEIIWRSNHLDDYSELLEAKANYEKRHHNK